MAAPAPAAPLSPQAKQLLAPIVSGFRFLLTAPTSAAEAPSDRTAAMLAANAAKARLHLALTLVALASLGTGIAAAEGVYDARLADPGNPLGSTPGNTALKLATTVLTAALLALLALFYWVEYQLQVLQGHLLPSQPFVETELVQWLALEAALLGVHAPVGCYALWSTTNLAGVRIVYDADSMLTILMMYRFKPLVFLLMDWLSGFHSDRALLISRRVEVRLNTETATRYLLKKFSIVSATAMYVLLVMLLSYCMRVVERPLCRSAEAVAAAMCPSAVKDIDSVYNTFWLVLVTSLTVGALGERGVGGAGLPPQRRAHPPLNTPHTPHTHTHTRAHPPPPPAGYGDLTPVTHLGRFVAVLSAVSGICVIALLVNAVANYSRLDEAEDRACALLELWGRNSDKQRSAARLQRDFLRFCVGKLRLAREARAGRGRPASTAHHLRYSRPLIRSLAAFREHKLTWMEARRRKDTVFAIRQDLRELRNLVVEMKLGLAAGAPAREPAREAQGAAAAAAGALPVVQVRLREPVEG